jgi:hypothetical protein
MNISKALGKSKFRVAQHVDQECTIFVANPEFGHVSVAILANQDSVIAVSDNLRDITDGLNPRLIESEWEPSMGVPPHIALFVMELVAPTIGSH